MAKKEERKEQRRFEEKDRKPWTKEEREKYEALRARIAPFIRDLTTPAPSEKKKDELEELFKDL